MDISGVKQKIKAAYGRIEVSLYALCVYYAGMAINYFHSVQPAKTNSPGLFWHNKSGVAALKMFTEAIRNTGNWYGWKMGHGVQYGTYLELANDRRHEAIRPVIERFAGRFIADARSLFKD